MRTAGGYRVSAKWLRSTIAAMFAKAGLSEAASGKLADVLVDADVHGVGSHGTMLVPLYVERIRAGSVSTAESAEVVSDHGAVAVLDAHNALGQLTSIQAMELAVQKARSFGLGAVAVRHAFHFGRGARYVEAAAKEGLIGVALSNTRPLMPAPGGKTPVVGNNPVAVGFPRAGEDPLVIDLALAQSSMGAIRLAAQEARSIPPGWATDTQGRPTTDPQEAIAGMLLPAGGHKGFALALAVEVLTGVLAGGAIGPEVRGLYSTPSEPYDCSHLFVALAVDVFDERDRFGARLEELCSWMTAGGSDDVACSGTGSGPRLPGEAAKRAAQESERLGVELAASVMEELLRAARELSVPVGDPE